MEEIGVVAPVRIGKEKKIEQEAVKKAELKESAKGTKVGPETKKRNIVKSQKQLVISEEPERVDLIIVGKEVGHPLIPKIRVKTKVESSLSLSLSLSLSQVPVSSSAQGSLGSFDFL